MIGKTLGHYRVGEQLGRGGMGEVYVADDLNLSRKVALKLLPEAFAADPERMARFEREAKLLASLNHPNIAAIYGLEQAEGKRFLVLELVEGETLAQRLSKGALPVEEALGICRQIADALEAAHEKGVIHRDLKPANVMISEGDKVKILDFGLAKALSDETQSVDSSQSPTLTEAMTRPGVILGTAAYMSPEQAKGKAVDKRADIWAFGCILYECLTGKRAFEGETVTETLASVLTREPEWEKIPANVRLLLRRCLEKDPKKRLRDVGEAMAWIENPPETVPESTLVKRPWLGWIAALLFFLVALTLAFLHIREKPSIGNSLVRFHVDLPDNVRLNPDSAFTLSPDGRFLVFDGIGADGSISLWIRALDSLDVRRLPGTESTSLGMPFWSPDSRFIAFDGGGKLKKIDISGGPPQTVCELSGVIAGGSWNRDGVIIFGNYRGTNTLMRVSATGGSASPLTKLNPGRKELGHYNPVFLPDGRHFLYKADSATPENVGTYVSSLDSKPEEQDRRQILATGSWISYVPAQDSNMGWLLFLRDQTIMAQPFDSKRLELIGEPLPVAGQVVSAYGFWFHSASTNGVLVYRSGGALEKSQLTWFDRQGKILGTAGERGMYGGLALSPDGSRAAVGWAPTQSSASWDIWLIDFARGTNTRFTFAQQNSSSGRPVWSPDGTRIIFSSNLTGPENLYQKPTSGFKKEELLLKSSQVCDPTSWSSDGRFVLYSALYPKTKADLMILPLESGKELPFLRTEFNEFDGHFSPDMRWVAYVSDETGNDEVYVTGFSRASGGAVSEPGGKWLISKGGGAGPRWRGDGKELYYRAPDGKAMAVEIAAGTAFVAGMPKALFQAPVEILTLAMTGRHRNWDVSPDGKRFLLSTPVAESPLTPITVILNWTALLKK
jgi:serine/threonine protein kinase